MVSYSPVPVGEPQVTSRDVSADSSQAQAGLDMDTCCHTQVRIQVNQRDIKAGES